MFSVQSLYNGKWQKLKRKRFLCTAKQHLNIVKAMYKNSNKHTILRIIDIPNKKCAYKIKV